MLRDMRRTKDRAGTAQRASSSCRMMINLLGQALEDRRKLACVRRISVPRGRSALWRCWRMRREAVVRDAVDRARMRGGRRCRWRGVMLGGRCVAHSWQGGGRGRMSADTRKASGDVWDAPDEWRSEQNDHRMQRKGSVRRKDTRIPDVLHERISMWGWGKRKEMYVEGRTRRLWGSPWRRS